MASVPIAVIIALSATRTIPIVLTGVTDPVGNGFITSLAHPGGNTTGLPVSNDDISPKQLELLATVVPNTSPVGLLENPASPNYSLVLKNAQDAAGSGFRPETKT